VLIPSPNASCPSGYGNNRGNWFHDSDVSPGSCGCGCSASSGGTCSGIAASLYQGNLCSHPLSTDVADWTSSSSSCIANLAGRGPRWSSVDSVDVTQMGGGASCSAGANLVTSPSVSGGQTVCCQ